MKVFGFILLLVLGAATCKKGSQEQRQLQKLYERYQDGEIQSCTHQGKTVYAGSLNAPDAGMEIFSESGEQIGACYFSTGVVDPICKEMEDCEVIYRVEKNIWGKPGVDKYGLGEAAE